MLPDWFLIGLAGLAFVLVAWGILVYNGLVRARNETRNAWSQIDVQLKRRHDLVPNLVETAKAYMAHEKETFRQVTEARAAAMKASDPAARGTAESLLGAALSGLFVVAEAYPELKANQNFLAIQEELASTENRIGFARQAYNDAATRYNTRREVFPANLISGGFKRAELFEIEDAAERRVPAVEA